MSEPDQTQAAFARKLAIAGAANVPGILLLGFGLTGIPGLSAGPIIPLLADERLAYAMVGLGIASTIATSIYILLAVAGRSR